MSVVIRLKAGQAGSPFPGGEINILFLKREDRFRGPSSVQFSGYRRPTLGSKQPRHEADHSLSLSVDVNPLNPELNPICYLLALLRAHHFSTLAG